MHLMQGSGGLPNHSGWTELPLRPPLPLRPVAPNAGVGAQACELGLPRAWLSFLRRGPCARFEAVQALAPQEWHASPQGLQPQMAWSLEDDWKEPPEGWIPADPPGRLSV